MAKSDSTTTTFPKVGDNIAKHVMNMSRRPSPYTTLEPKKTEGRGASPTGRKANRGATMIHEANGPKCHIDQVLYKANAPEAGMQMRNVRLMKPAMGDQDFRSRKTYRQGV